MKHMTLPRFWQTYAQLPLEIQQLADKNFALLKAIHIIPHSTSRKLERQNSCGQCGSALITAP